LVRNSGRLKVTAAGLWFILLAVPLLALGIGNVVSVFGSPALVAFVATWILAAVFLVWGHWLIARLKRATATLRATRAELDEALGQIRETARNDSLTGAANQWFMYEILRQEWGRAERTGSPLSVVLVEFDGLDSYVDSYGDPAGDSLLRQAAEMITGELKRPGDLLARLGGKRFVVVLPDTDLEGGALIAERLRVSVENSTEFQDAGRITLSAGVAVRTAFRQENERELLEVARDCLASAKKAGGNQVLAHDHRV
jgi:diguanylate cyclase (GGDEF)-like protein